MDNKEAALLALLQQLQSQLQESSTVNPTLTTKVQTLVDEIAASLPRTEKPVPQQEPQALPLTDRLRQSVLDFESAHPTLSQTLGNIADTLAQMGI